MCVAPVLTDRWIFVSVQENTLKVPLSFKPKERRFIRHLEGGGNYLKPFFT